MASSLQKGIAKKGICAGNACLPDAGTSQQNSNIPCQPVNLKNKDLRILFEILLDH
jgi:hypothetical protein